MNVRCPFAVALCCAAAFAQLPPPQAPRPFLLGGAAKHGEAPVITAHIDAIVTDTAGHPVSGLTEADFELLQDDKPRDLAGVSYIGSTKGRMLVLVIDDLTLTSKPLAATREAIRQFIRKELQPGDRVAIVPVSKASGSRETFSAEPDFLLESVNALQPALQWAERPADAARGALCQLRLVVESLRQEPGRKAVVFFSGNLHSASGILPAVFASLASSAGSSSTVLYDVDPTEPAPAPVDSKAAVPVPFATRSKTELAPGLPRVARQTGGLAFETGAPESALEKIVQDMSGYYRLSYQVLSGAEEFLRVQNLRVRVKRPELAVRASETPVVNEGGYGLAERALMQADALPFSARPLPVRLAPRFLNGPQGSSLEALVHLDVHEIGMTQDLKGIRHAAIDVAMATLGPDGQPADQTSSLLTLKIPPAEIPGTLRDGVSFAMTLPLRRTSPGGWQVLLLARDETSARLGAAMQFIEVPDLEHGKLAISGIALESAGSSQSESGSGTPASNDSAVLRIFHHGETLRYHYSLYNAASDKDKRSHFEIQIRLYCYGETVFLGKSLPLDFSPSDSPRRRSAAGSLTLPAALPPGRYRLELLVKDKLAPASSSSGAAQYADFELKP